MGEKGGGGFNACWGQGRHVRRGAFVQRALQGLGSLLLRRESLVGKVGNLTFGARTVTRPPDSGPLLILDRHHSAETLI